MGDWRKEWSCQWMIEWICDCMSDWVNQNNDSVNAVPWTHQPLLKARLSFIFHCCSLFLNPNSELFSDPLFFLKDFNQYLGPRSHLYTFEPQNCVFVPDLVLELKPLWMLNVILNLILSMSKFPAYRWFLLSWGKKSIFVSDDK